MAKDLEKELEQALMQNLELEVEEQEIRRYYRDENGQLCEVTEIIKVPTGKLRRKTPDQA